jgi:hypothetical protein
VVVCVLPSHWWLWPAHCGRDMQHFIVVWTAFVNVGRDEQMSAVVSGSEKCSSFGAIRMIGPAAWVSCTVNKIDIAITCANRPKPLQCIPFQSRMHAVRRESHHGGIRYQVDRTQLAGAQQMRAKRRCIAQTINGIAECIEKHPTAETADLCSDWLFAGMPEQFTEKRKKIRVSALSLMVQSYREAFQMRKLADASTAGTYELLAAG